MLVLLLDCQGSLPTTLFDYQCLMPRHTKPPTITSKLRAEVIALLVKELGYKPAQARSLVIRHEGLMLKAVAGDQPVGPIALAIHLAHERECVPAA
jgi:hypothetical protein